MVIIDTRGGGDCMFDAVGKCSLWQFNMIRTIPEMRLPAALELETHSAEYENNYVVEDNGQFEQAPTFELG